MYMVHLCELFISRGKVQASWVVGEGLAWNDVVGGFTQMSTRMEPSKLLDRVKEKQQTAVTGVLKIMLTDNVYVFMIFIPRKLFLLN